MLARKKTGWIGFDIGATSVKVAQVVRTDAGPCIRSAAIVPRSERWSSALLAEDQPRSSADELAAAASLCQRLSGADAATLLPLAMCELLQMDVPAAKRGADPPDYIRAIEVETQRPMRGRVFDHWPLAGQAGKMNVVTAPRAWSDRISADVAAGGWRCRTIDALPGALARAASLVHTSTTGRPIAALDWAYGKSTVCLVHNGVPALVRSLKDCAFQTVLDTISTGLRIDERDAEALLQNYGLETDPADRVADPAAACGDSRSVIDDLLELPLGRLTQQLRRTFDYWRGVTRGQAPEAVYVFGGGGTLRGIGSRLSKQLDLPVQPWQLPVEQPADAAMPPACLFGAAVGLSAAAWETP